MAGYPRHPLLDLAAAPDREIAGAFPGGVVISNGELRRRALALARALHGYGIRPGSRVALLLRNSPGLLVALQACWAAGVVAAPLNVRWRGSELASAIGPLQPAVVLTEAAARPGLALRAIEAGRLLAGAAPLIAVVDAGGPACGLLSPPDLEGAAAGAPDPPGAPDPDAAAVLVHTSGTAARPRACLLGGDRLAANARATARRLRFTAEERFWNPLPLYHVGGLIPWLALTAAGGALLSAPRFEASSALRLMRRQGVTFAYPMFPHILQALVENRAFEADSLDRLRTFAQVAAEPQMRAAQDALPQAIEFSAYGSTEAGAVSFGDLGDPLEARMTTCGRPLDGMEVRIAAGELLVRGEGVMLGWDGDARPPIDAAGWFHTGDLAEIDSEGRIRYVGRRADTIKVGGENVSPAEVEAWLCRHPAVGQAVVVGLPHRLLGQVPAAAVQLRRGQAAGADHLVEHCRRGLAAFKVPTRVIFVRRWPMSATKVNRAALRDRFK